MIFQSARQLAAGLMQDLSAEWRERIPKT